MAKKHDVSLVSNRTLALSAHLPKNDDRLLNGFINTDIGATAAKAHFVRSAAIQHVKMLS